MVLDRVKMASSMQTGRSNIHYVALALSTVVISLTFLLNEDASIQIMSAFSGLSFIRGPAKDDLTSTISNATIPASPVVCAPVPSVVPRAVELEDVLAQASMANKTVIITALNEAWAANDSMIDIFLKSFRVGENIEHLVQHLVIVCVDKKAYERCVQLHPHCFQMKTDGVDFEAEKRFMTEDFLKMMWRRIEFLGEVLQLGFSFIFTDGDILWFRDPFTLLSNDDAIDVQISSDRALEHPIQTYAQSPNSGFLYVRSNNRTIAMYKYWYEARLRYPGSNDQMVVTGIFKEGDFRSQVGVKVQYFDPVYFSGFCTVSRDMNKVVTMHSNCCIGLKSKLYDLHLALEDWKSYRNASQAENKGNITDLPREAHWRAPLKCVASLRKFEREHSGTHN